MRWLFMLLVVLNGFYYVWHQQEAPLQAKEIASLEYHRGARQDIQLLSESGIVATDRGKSKIDEDCLYLGVDRPDQALSLVQRLVSIEISATVMQQTPSDAPGYWVRVAPESRHFLDDLFLQNLSNEFNELKHKIMPCEALQVSESLNRMAPAPQQ